MNKLSEKAYVSVKSKYYKIDAAFNILDHSNALRAGYTKSTNVHSVYSKNNFGLYSKGCHNNAEALEKACERYKKLTGKKVRKDFNLLFEHVVILTESQYSKLEKLYGKEQAKKEVMKHLAKYAMAIKKEFGFEPLGVDLHLDEGHFITTANTGPHFVRNVHAHVQFFNYDFKCRVAPLRHLMAKGKDRNDRTNQLNPNFEKMQDIVANIFAPIGFNRGESKNITGRVHLEKEHFVKEKLQRAEQEVEDLANYNKELTRELELQKLRSDYLANEINQQEEKISWLKQKIYELNGVAEELEAAIKKRCKKAFNFISKKVSSSQSILKSPQR